MARNSERHLQGMNCFSRFSTSELIWDVLVAPGKRVEASILNSWLRERGGSRAAATVTLENGTHTHLCTHTHYISQQMPGDTSEFMLVTR